MEAVCKNLWGKKIYNLTPHRLNFVAENNSVLYINRSGSTIRVDTEKESVESPIPGFESVYRMTPGQIGGLPESNPNSLFLCSSYTRLILSRRQIERNDILCPYMFDSIIDEKGNLTSVAKALANYSSNYSDSCRINNTKLKREKYWSSVMVDNVKVVNLTGRPIKFLIGETVYEVDGSMDCRSSIIYEKEKIENDLKIGCGTWMLKNPVLYMIPDREPDKVFIVPDKVKNELSVKAPERTDILSPHIVADKKTKRGVILSFVA